MMNLSVVSIRLAARCEIRCHENIEQQDLQLTGESKSKRCVRTCQIILLILPRCLHFTQALLVGQGFDVAEFTWPAAMDYNGLTRLAGVGSNICRTIE